MGKHARKGGLGLFHKTLHRFTRLGDAVAQRPALDHQLHHPEHSRAIKALRYRGIDSLPSGCRQMLQVAAFRARINRRRPSCSRNVPKPPQQAEAGRGIGTPHRCSEKLPCPGTHHNLAVLETLPQPWYCFRCLSIGLRSRSIAGAVEEKCCTQIDDRRFGADLGNLRRKLRGGTRHTGSNDLHPFFLSNQRTQGVCSILG